MIYFAASSRREYHYYRQRVDMKDSCFSCLHFLELRGYIKSQSKQCRVSSAWTHAEPVKLILSILPTCCG